MLIALLEDEQEQAEYVKLWLSSAGYNVDHYSTGSSFKEGIVVKDYDLCILDWELPDINGDIILDWIRNDLGSEVLIIFSTAHNTEADIVKILQLGADDYMVKPINPLEILARIQALTRRLSSTNKKPDNITINNVSLDLERRSVIVDNEICELTPKEFDLAVYLFKHLGNLVSREELLKTIWKINADIDTRTVDTHISRLRKKLKLVTSKGWNLNVVYQYGYRLDKIETEPQGLNS